MYRRILLILLLVGAMITLAGCHKSDDHRLPWAEVYIPFLNIAQWERYGVGGAMESRIFNIQAKLPADFPYAALHRTGFGGVLLVADAQGTPLAYDLACPVEVRYDVRLYINGRFEAECPVCHSTFDVFHSHGAPLSGKAAGKGYALTRYTVGPGANGEYLLIHH